MDDVDENAIIVNALQRHAAVVVQKSLVEGFGLTVTEAMWKGRPVVASKVGGIQDQITDGRDGLLVDDPYDIEGFAAAPRPGAGRPGAGGAAGRRGPRAGAWRSSSATAISSSTSTSSPAGWVTQDSRSLQLRRRGSCGTCVGCSWVPVSTGLQIHRGSTDRLRVSVCCACGLPYIQQKSPTRDLGPTRA